MKLYQMSVRRVIFSNLEDNYKFEFDDYFQLSYLKNRYKTILTIETRPDTID